jgi:hypothetical protein
MPSRKCGRNKGYYKEEVSDEKISTGGSLVVRYICGGR